MKRQTFINIINDINNQTKQDRETTEKLKSIMVDGDGFFITPLVHNIVLALESEFDDSDQTISWWLWDAPTAGKDATACTVKHNDKRYHLTDSGKLYDYLVEVQEAKNSAK